VLFKIANILQVTGGGTGIGLMIAQAFANNGARVYVGGRRRDVLARTVETWGSTLAHPKGKLLPVELDVTRKDSIAALVEEIGKKEKSVEVLVNNAVRANADKLGDLASTDMLQGVTIGTSNVEAGDESAEKLKDVLFSEDAGAWEDVYRTNVMG
jgi:NAD(P)-dependent dehydrogenase (short-subunit alcohol dehydrogenase family)